MKNKGFSYQMNPFGYMSSGQAINQYIITNPHGLRVAFINYGATLTSLKVPDTQGRLIELTLGFDNLADYIKHPFYFGCTVGRVANRIAKSQFQLAGKRYFLTSSGQHYLHSGDTGFDKMYWPGEVYETEEGVGMKFTYLSPDGQGGFPGNLAVVCTYLLTRQNALKISYTATCDKETLINLTNHTYWNLAGAGQGTILTHELAIQANAYLETSSDLIPTGKLIAVAHTPYDFRAAQLIGQYLPKERQGYDVCYALNFPRDISQWVARVTTKDHKRSLTVFTDQAGLQFYTGNNLYHYPLQEGQFCEKWGGFCLEAQGYPDAINHPHFPSITLQPGQRYQHETHYQLSF